MEGVGPGLVIAGRYTLRRRIEAVRSTERWTAEDGVLARTVVLLLVEADDTRSAAILDAARRAAAVDLPSFVRVLDVGTEEEHAYVVEEDFSAHSSLAAIVLEGGVPAEEVRRIVGEVSVALDAASRRGLHHVELGPGEIFRTTDGDIRIRGLEVAAARSGRPSLSGEDALRADAVGTIALTYAGLTGAWPLLSKVRGSAGGLPPAPRSAAGSAGAAVVAPSEIVMGVPRDLDTLCQLTLAENAGPTSPGDYARQIAPWSSRQVVGKAPARRVSGDLPGVSEEVEAPTEPVQPTEPPTVSEVEDQVEDSKAPLVDPEDTDERGHVPAAAPVEDVPPAAVARLTPRNAQAPAAAAAMVGVAAGAAAGVASGQASAAQVVQVGPTSETDLAAHDTDPPGDDEPRPAAAVVAAVSTAMTSVGGKVADLARKAVDKVSELAPETISDDPHELEAPAPLVSNEVLNRKESRIALAIVAAFLLVGLVIGIQGVLRIGQEPFGPAPASARPTAKASPAGSATPSDGLEEFQIVAAADFDPLGGDGENPQLAARVYDDDAKTEWQSERYWTAAFGGVKSGVGILVDLGPNKTPKKVTVTLAIPASFDIYVASERSLDGATKIGSKTMVSGTQTVLAATPVKGQYVIVWFTQLSKDSTGRNDYRARVGEITVSG